MKIIDESVMTVGRANDYCINKVIMHESFRDFIDELYGIDSISPADCAVNAVAVAVDISFAINTFNKNRSAVSRPIRTPIHIKKLDNLDEEDTIISPLDSILVELNGDIYDITNLKKLPLDNNSIVSEEMDNHYVEITPSPLYNKIVEYFENSTVIDYC